ncbi:MAG: YfhO family protein [Deltaproteobacteria bacterium]|nr:YfhO family protein [Deltaproteobacteria bacterium]
MSLMFFFAIIYLAALSALYFYSAIGGGLLLTERDLSVFFIPPRHLWVELLRGGEFPLWNPYSYSGHPLLATLQPGIFYPVNLLLLVLPFDLAFNWTIIIHFFIAGISTYALMREVRAGKAGALAGALTFMLSGYLFSAHNVMSTLFSVAWVPLAAFTFLRAIRRGSSLYAALTGIVLSMMFLGGGIEVFFGTIVLLIFMLALPGIFDFEDTDAARISPVKRSLLLVYALAVFFLLCAVQILPFLELASFSTRAGGLGYLEATTWSLDIKDFIQFFIPDPYGYMISDEKYWANQSWLKTVYLGFVPFILSIFFVLRSKKKPLAFIMTALFFLSMAMGRNNAFYYYLHSYIPVLNKFRYPVKFLFVPFLFISMGAGLGYDRFKEAAKEAAKPVHRALLLLLVISTLAAIALGILNFYHTDIEAYLVSRGIDFPVYNHVSVNLFNTKRALVFLIIFSTGLFLAFRSARLRKLLPYFVVVTLSIDLFFAHNGYYATTKAEDYYAKSKVMEFMEGDKGLYRVFVTPRTMNENVEITETDAFDRELIQSLDLQKERLTGFNLLHKIFDIEGAEVMKRGDYTNLFTLMASLDRADSTNIPSMLNVKYVVSILKIDSPEYRLKKIIGARDGNVRGIEGEKALKIYENLNYVPRFFMVDSYRVIKDPREYLETLVDKKFSPGRLVLLEEEPGAKIKPSDGKTRPECPVEVLNYKNNSVELMVRCSSDAILVASESYYPGWKAYVDGSEEKILKADYVLRAVPLKAGAHTVVFKYSPLSFKAGLFVSAISAVLIPAFCLAYFVRKEKQ